VIWFCRKLEQQASVYEAVSMKQCNARNKDDITDTATVLQPA